MQQKKQKLRQALTNLKAGVHSEKRVRRLFQMSPQNHAFTAICLMSLSAALAFVLRPSGDAVPVFSVPVNQRVVMIDAGHGGWDPGKPGIAGADEKHINLAIAENLQIFLEYGGSFTVMTRVDDEALADKKRDDMHNRTQLGNDAAADITVSIHQNSFPSAEVKGAQVFYSDASESGKLLAACVQKSINDFADVGNHRTEKASPDYYMLKKTSSPAIIVECGFLSYAAEEQQLNTEEYQEKIAWAIYSGINDYFAETP